MANPKILGSKRVVRVCQASSRKAHNWMILQGKEVLVESQNMEDSNFILKGDEKKNMAIVTAECKRRMIGVDEDGQG